MRSMRFRLSIGFATLLVALCTRVAPASAATPTLSVGPDIEIFEEARGIPTANVVVRLSAPTDHQVTAQLMTVDGTAFGDYVGDSDYFNETTRVTIPAGETSSNEVSIGIVADDLVEGDEHFFVRLLDPVGATIADGSATVVIHNADTDQDPPPALVDSKDVPEADTDTTVSVLVRLGAYSSTEQTVTVRTRDVGDATAGEDYEGVVVVLRFPAGTLTQRFNVTIHGDQLDEDPESFLVEVVDGFSTTTPWEGSNSVTIYDDDSPSSK